MNESVYSRGFVQSILSLQNSMRALELFVSLESREAKNVSNIYVVMKTIDERNVFCIQNEMCNKSLGFCYVFSFDNEKKVVCSNTKNLVPE